MTAAHAPSTGELVSRIFQSIADSVMIEIADRCNENCIHCYQVQGQKGEMSTEEIKDLLDELADAGVLFLVLSGGEATLRDDLLEIIAHARKRRFAVDLFTNGLRITEELAAALAAQHLRCVEISLYSPKAEVHDWITRVPGSFERTVAGIRRLREHGVRVKLKSPLFAVNAPERLQLEALADELGADFTMDASIRAREDGDRTPERLRPSLEEVRDFFREAYPTDGPIGPRDPERRVCGTCDELHVEPNGQLRPCALLDVDLGDVRKTPVKELLAGRDARFLKSLHWKDLPGCADCAIAGACTRCHSQSLREVGDALRPYPSACADALIYWESSCEDRGPVEGRGSTLVGPFRRLEDGTLEPYGAPANTEAQEAMYQEHPWLRRQANPPEAPVQRGQLVQLRRPGRRDRTEQIPK